MPIQSEAALEAGLIATLRQMDYEYVQIAEEDNLQANFKRQLEIHNRKRLAEHDRTEFTDEEFDKILIYLEGGTRFEKAKKLRDLYPLDTADGKRIWVEFLNRQQWCQNEFQVSNQITVEGRKKCRYDVTILINGLPLVQIELKRRGVELKQAYNQIQRYHKTSFHGLFDYIQLFVISNGVNTRYFANNPNGGYKFTFNFKIENGDTLEWDAFGDTQFDAVVANPPFSAEWSAADKFNNDDRFSKAGRLAPKKTADYAFILYMIYHLNEGGTMACVAPHGVLFRGNAEGVIRRFLIEKKNYIDAVIGLPANIFYGTSIPTCILVLKKCRKEDDNILFIDASKEFEKVKTQNKLRPQHIQKIVETYRDRKEIEKYSHLATLQEVADNDYNLNIPRYVDTFEEEEPIDIKAVMAEIKELEAKRAELDKEIDVYLKELGIVE